MKKSYLVAVIILILIVAIMVGYCTANINSKKISINLSDLISNENIEHISLKINYLSPYALTMVPVSIDQLKYPNADYKIIIKGDELLDLIQLLNQLKTVDLIPVKEKTVREDVRLYYLLESKKNGELLEIILWGLNKSIYVNGQEVKEKTKLYQLIMPYLPDDIREEFESFI